MDQYDWIALAGLLLLTTGLYFIYAPLALVVPGLLLILVGLFGSRGRAPRK